MIVRVDFAELEPTSDFGPSSLSIFIDTDRSARGPEFRIGTGLQEGTDYQLVRMKKWKAVGEPLSCKHAVDLDFDDNQARARVNRSCLGNPEKVRIGVKMTDLYDGSHPVVDWLGKRRYLSIPHRQRLNRSAECDQHHGGSAQAQADGLRAVHGLAQHQGGQQHREGRVERGDHGRHAEVALLGRDLEHPGRERAECPADHPAQCPPVARHPVLPQRHRDQHDDDRSDQLVERRAAGSRAPSGT